MKIFLENMIIKSRNEVFEIPFSKKMTYYYGPSSVGKSTILRLIDWCLGAEDVERTTEITNLFLGATLNILLEDTKISLSRDFGENEIVVDYVNSKNEEISRKIPIKAKEYPVIPEQGIYNISDFLFTFSGLKPPRVRRSRYDVDSDLVRLSFRDVMWYCYLKQEQMINSLFYLDNAENYFKQLKSRDALRYFLQYNVDEVAELEEELFQLQQQKVSETNTISELSTFLSEQRIDNQETLSTERNECVRKISELNKSIADVRNSNKNKTYDSTLDMRTKRQSLLVYIEKINEEINNVEKRLEQQQSLRSEYVTANTKVIRTFSAKEFFKDLRFHTCPKCGKKINDEPETETCVLCKQSNDEKQVFDARKLDIDLTKRIKELDEWIKRLEFEKNKLDKNLKQTLDEKYRIDEDLDELSQTNDSNYLSNARNLEHEKFRLEGRIQTIDKFIPMLQKITKLKENIQKMEKNIEGLKQKIRLEKEKIRDTNQNLSELKRIFKQILLSVHFPDFNDVDEIMIDPFTLSPRIKKIGMKIETILDFNNMGSAGKKNIFKSCYAIAIHILSEKIHGALPSFLIIDTPMQHINEELDLPLFKSYYQLLYKVSQNELKNHQLILVDKKDFRDVTGLHMTQLNCRDKSTDDYTVRFMTKDNSEYPPLFL